MNCPPPDVHFSVAMQTPGAPAEPVQGPSMARAKRGETARVDGREKERVRRKRDRDRGVEREGMVGSGRSRIWRKSKVSWC